MIEGWAIYPTPERGSSNAFDWMISSAASCGIELSVVFAEKISFNITAEKIELYNNGEKCAFPHFVLMRHYDFNLSAIFESCGVRVFNSTRSMQLSQNKLLTHLLLNKNNIPTIDTICGDVDFSVVTSCFGLPFVVKAVRGSKGEEVYLINNNEEFERVREQYNELLAQRFISSSYGKDIRVWVVGERVVGTVLRRSVSSFKSNIALGGEAICFEASVEVQQMAINSCKAVGLELGGVDILFMGDGKYCVCEVNGNAGFRAFGLSGKSVDIPKEIFNYISSSLTIA